MRLWGKLHFFDSSHIFLSKEAFYLVPTKLKSSNHAIYMASIYSLNESTCAYNTHRGPFIKFSTIIPHLYQSHFNIRIHYEDLLQNHFGKWARDIYLPLPVEGYKMALEKCAVWFYPRRNERVRFKLYNLWPRGRRHDVRNKHIFSWVVSALARFANRAILWSNTDGEFWSSSANENLITRQ